MPSVHTKPEEYKKTQQSPVFLDLCLKRIRAWKSPDYREINLIKKFRFQNVFRAHENEKPAFSNSSWFEERFRKATFLWRISVDGRRNHRNKTTFLTCSVDGGAQKAESIACTITFYINRPITCIRHLILFQFRFCFLFVIVVELVICRINCWF